MNKAQKQLVLLLGLTLLSLLLRLHKLDAKPLWIDEILTTLFSLGHSFNDLPLGETFSLNSLPNIFTFTPKSCTSIAETVSRESTHPPLFFCLSHFWLQGLKPIPSLAEIVWRVRLLPALLGVAVTLAMYNLGRLAFSPTTGLVAAAFAAVSPFAVYLSQEARHYTLAILLITLSLLKLISIEQDYSQQGKVKIKNWLPWVIFTTLGLYTHYFFALAYISQVSALLLWLFWYYWRRQRFLLFWMRQFYFCILPSILLLPWLPVLLQHSHRPETNWLKFSAKGFLDYLTPLLQIPLGWILMVVALPVETPHLWLTIPSALLMLTFAFFLGRDVWQRLSQLLHSQNPIHQQSTILLCGFIAFNLAQFLLIIYLLGKDITAAVRYHFVYYPAICLLLAACFTCVQNPCQNRRIKMSYPTICFVGLLSSLCVTYGLVFAKPYRPEWVARQLNLEPQKPLVVVSGYRRYQEIALGLSFALELDKLRPSVPTFWLFINTRHGYSSVEQTLSRLSNSLAQLSPNLWFIAPGLRRKDFPPALPLTRTGTCLFDNQHHYRLGIPYQHYRCSFTRASVPPTPTAGDEANTPVQ